MMGNSNTTPGGQRGQALAWKTLQMLRLPQLLVRIAPKSSLLEPEYLNLDSSLSLLDAKAQPHVYTHSLQLEITR